MLALEEKMLLDVEALTVLSVFLLLGDVRSRRKNVFPSSGSHLCL